MRKFLSQLSSTLIIQQFRENIIHIIFTVDIARLLKNFKNTVNIFPNILTIFPHFNAIFLQYFINNLMLRIGNNTFKKSACKLNSIKNIFLMILVKFTLILLVY